MSVPISTIAEDLAIRYVVGGSLASSLYEIPRATQDVDLVAEIEHPHVEALTGSLAGDFYVDARMIRISDLLGRAWQQQPDQGPWRKGIRGDLTLG